MKEYIIWGKENKTVEHERVLVDDGLKSMDHALETMETLKQWGCIDMRIQVIDFSDPSSINRLFAQSINI